MRGDENRNIDVPSKVKAFRKDFPPDKGIISTSFEVKDIGGVPAVVGKAIVGVLVDGDKVPTLLSEAYATRGLRAPVPGAQGMKDTRDAERAMTGAVGRALFLMGYGEKPDDSVDYEPEEQTDWFVASGWRSQEHHDDMRAAVLEAMKELPTKEDRRVAWDRWGEDEKPARAVTYAELEAFSQWLIPFGRRAKEDAQSKAEGVGDGDEPAPTQPPLNDAVGPDAPLVKR